MKLKIGDKIEVEWPDIVACSAWTDMDDAKKYTPKSFFNIGYYLNEDDVVLRIYDSIDSETSKIGYTVIPKGCIKKIRRLK